jgi:bacterial/archaeal transporter family-2 protein
VTGQNLSAIAVDTFGLFSAAKKPLSVSRIAGVAIAISGLATSAILGGINISWMVLLPFISGLFIGIQQAVNGALGHESGSPIVTTFLNFLAGGITTSLGLMIFRVDPTNISWPSNPLLYSGGLIGILFIVIQVIVVRKIGVLVMATSLLSGQVIAAAIIDLVAPEGMFRLSAGSGLALIMVLAGLLLVLRKPKKVRSS